MKPPAVLLAGGLARRMGGGDKPLRLLGGKPILAHVIARLAPQTSALAINANGDPARLDEFGLPVLVDAIPGYPGPLAGIQAGMAWAQRSQTGATHIASIPGDLPFLPPDLIARLEDVLAAGDAEIAIARSEGHVHPVVALWPVGLADALHRAVEDGLRRVREFQGRYRVAYADFPVGAIDPFFNVNTPEDLERAERLV